VILNFSSLHAGFELHRWLAHTSLINSSDDGVAGQPLNDSEIPSLLHGNVTLESALDNDDNMLQKIAYPDLRFEFYLSLFKRRSDIEAIVSHHQRLRKTETCQLGEFKDWKSGSFNVCIRQQLG
jgi:hypothetical protein